MIIKMSHEKNSYSSHDSSIHAVNNMHNNTRDAFVSCQPYVCMVSPFFFTVPSEWLSSFSFIIYILSPSPLSVPVISKKELSMETDDWLSVPNLSSSPDPLKRKTTGNHHVYHSKKAVKCKDKKQSKQQLKKKQRYCLSSSLRVLWWQKSRVSLYLMQDFEKEKGITRKTEMLSKIKAVSAQNGYKSCKRQKWNEMRKKRKEKEEKDTKFCMFHGREKVHWWS